LWFDEFDAARQGGDEPAVGAKDAVAESLYKLIGEVFDMRGVFKLLRKSLMTFAQITYGSTINRQIRDTVAWVTSEQMILWYLSSFKKAYWPSQAKREEEVKDEDALANQTRDALVKAIPEVLNNLVGQQAAVNGAVKVFEALQSEMLNKQLFYELLEMLTVEIFGELKKGGKMETKGI